MSAQQEKVRHIPRTGGSLPVPDETPTLRLGSMLQTVREQCRKEEASDYPVTISESIPNILSMEELDAAEKIPRRHLPLLVFTAGLALAALSAATWPKAKVLLDRFAAMWPGSASQTLVVEPVNAGAVNTAPAEIPPVAESAVEIAPDKPPSAPDKPPPAPSSRVQGEPSAPIKAAVSRRPRRSVSTRRLRSIPLRGYAWSPTANALVPIEPPDPPTEALPK